jgi:hypothetical protein
MIKPSGAPAVRRPPLPSRRLLATVAAVLACFVLAGFSRAHTEDADSTAPARQIWTCRYIAATPDGPLQIITKFEVVGEELAEFDTIPRGLSFNEKYKTWRTTTPISSPPSRSPRSAKFRRRA